MSNILNVYYGSDGLPYKDSARKVHFPIVGNEFIGASNVSAIKFYVNELGGIVSTTWVANTKLPDGSKVFEILNTTGNDNGEYYVQLTLSSRYTNKLGNIFVSLNGYSGGVSITDNGDSTYSITGTPTINATGVIKLNISYAVAVEPLLDLSVVEYQALYSLISSKGNVKYYSSLASATTDLTTNASQFNVGDLVLYKDNTNYDAYVACLVNSTKDGFDSIEYNVDSINGLNSGSSIDFNYNGDGIVKIENTYGDQLIMDDGVNLSTSDIHIGNTATTNNKLVEYGEVSTLLDNKVSKTTYDYLLYGTDGSGNQTTIPYDTFVSGQVVRRTDLVNGNIYVGSPSANNHATPKSYVDNQITGAKNYADSLSTTLQGKIDDCGHYLSISGGASTDFAYTIELKDKNTNVISTITFDLPLESVVVGGSYDENSQQVILTLVDGSTVAFSVEDLVRGLVSQGTFDALETRVGNVESGKVNYSDISTSGGAVVSITKSGTSYSVAENVSISTIPQVVQSTTDLPASNDGYLYLVLDNGYLYYYDNGWKQGYLYTSDLLTITTEIVDDYEE